MQSVRNIVIIGGGFGFYEVFGLIKDMNREKLVFNVIGILDDNEQLKGKYLDGVEVLGKISFWKKINDDVKFVFAIGNFENRQLRQQILQKNKIPWNRFQTLIHPSARIMIDRKSIGLGSIIHCNVVIYPLGAVGDFCIISSGCVFGIKNIIGSFSLFAVGVTTPTNISFGAFSFVGAGATFAPDIKIGCNSMIGVGAMVFKSVSPGFKVIGHPAKVYGKDQTKNELIKFSETDNNELVKKSLS